MRAFLFSVIAACAFASDAAAQQAVDVLTLERGQAATLQFDEGGAAIFIEGGAAPTLTAFESSVISDFVAGAYDHAVGDTTAPISSGGKRPQPEPVQPYAVRIKFVQAPGADHTILLIENGYPQAFRYRAIMTEPGERPQHTDVCIVLPELRSLEHWPFALERIELSALRLVPWREGDPVPCD